MTPLFTVGALNVTPYSLMILLGALSGAALSLRKKEIRPLLPAVILGALFFGHLFWVLFCPYDYEAAEGKLYMILRPWQGGYTLYGALAPEPAEGAMTRMTLGGTALEITLDGGESAFTAQAEGDRLILVPQGDGAVWTLNGYAIKALNRSGIAAVELTLGADTVAFPTDFAPRGDIYAALCAEGCVSSDYDYSVSASGVSVCVDGREYRLDASGQLLTTEG